MMSSDGDIIVGDITGGRVVISTDKADGTIDVSKGTITTDSYLGIHGDNVKGTIKAAKGDKYQGTMVFGITGAKGGAINGNMSLTNDGDTTFDILHITDGQISIGGNGTLKAENVKAKGLADNIGLFSCYNLYDSTHVRNDIAGFGTEDVLDINQTADGVELVGAET